MPISVPNPYSGQDEQTCSVSFAAQQQFLNSAAGPGGTGASNGQTEAEFNKSKLLGEWGVIKAKVAKGEIPSGVKLLTFENANGSRGYLYVNKGVITTQTYQANGTKVAPYATPPGAGETYINSKYFTTSIPQAVGSEANTAKGLAEKAEKAAQESASTFAKNSSISKEYALAVQKYGPSNVKPGTNGAPIVWASLKEFGLDKPDAEFIYHGPTKKLFMAKGKHVKVVSGGAGAGSFQLYTAQSNEYVLQQGSNSAKWWIELMPDHAKSESVAATPPPTPPSPQVAAPTVTAPVNSGSDSPGSMSHEDVSAMFVKIKDDLAKEQGLNVKGANPALDTLVYKAIGLKTGYTAAEVKAKIDAYKAAGNKLSALKKKVMAGTYKVPEGKNTDTAPQPTKAAPGAPLTEPQKPLAQSADGKLRVLFRPATFDYMVQTKNADGKWEDGPIYKSLGLAKKSHPKLSQESPVADPKPNGVPTVATPSLANAAKKDVAEAVNAAPAKIYSEEDVAAAYIIAKDKIVAASNGKWTLYTKSDELDLAIAIEVGLNTGGLTPLQQKAKIADYLASGKKLSVLKKQLIKQGTLKPQADTLKKKPTAPATVSAAANTGYTPEPKPTDPEPTATDPGAIDSIPEATKDQLYKTFKSYGYGTYLDSPEKQLYDSFTKLQAAAESDGKKFSLLQLIRVVDEQGAKKFNAENGKLFEKKVATWLTTPEGAQYVKESAAKVAKLAEETKKQAEIAAAAKKLQDSQPPLPADSALFRDMTPADGLRFQRHMLEKEPFRAGEKTALRHYSGNAYTAMNNHLRGIRKTTDPTTLRHIEKGKKAFRPSPEPALFKRGTGLIQFGLTDESLIWGITGKTFSDKGFLSTSSNSKAAFGGKVIMEVEAPAGTPMMYIDKMADGSPFSQHPGEYEMLFPPDTKMKVLNVRKEGASYIVRLRVVND